jgi:hypothetical protein
MRLRWKKEWTQLVILFLALRLLYSAIGMAVALGPNPVPQATGAQYDSTAPLLHPDRVSQLLVNVWFRWDTGWYLHLAAFGYIPGNGNTSFMPLYSWLIRGLASLSGNYLLSALIISNLAALAVFILLYETARQEGLDAKASLTVVVFFGLFPTAFFLFAAYTESTFLALVLGSWLVARRKVWLLAGLLGGLATLCRIQGVILSAVLVWLWLASLVEMGITGTNPLGQVRRVVGLVTNRSGWRTILASLRRPAWLGLLLPILTFAGYALGMRLLHLNFISDTLNSFWYIRTVMPWTGMVLFVERLFSAHLILIDYLDLIFLVFMLVLLVIGLRRLAPALTLYSFLTMAVLFMRGTPPTLLMSFSRYLLVLFPAFLILGKMRSRPLRLGLWMLSFTMQTVMLFGFLQWRFIA